MDRDDIIKLDDICESYFSICPVVARRKAADGLLPVPAFRIGSQKRGPFWVRRSDLDRHVDEVVTRAEALHRKMKQAGAA